MGVSMLPVRASVVLLTYNQEAFVQEALQSLLDQDYDDLEIVVSDDASKDDTWQVIQQTVAEYTGHKRVVLNKNEINLGIVGNYFKAFGLTTGDVIFTAAGDDVSLPSRCRECVSHWVASGRKPDLVASDGYDMSLDGHILGVKQTDDLDAWNISRWAEQRPFIFGASHMVVRRLLEVGDLNHELAYEDQCLLFRALLRGGAVRLAKPLVKHRRGGASQQKKNYVYEVKHQKLLASAVDGVLETQQMLKELLACEHMQVIELALIRQKRMNEFARDMLLLKNWCEKVNLFRSSRELPFVKRFRYFQFAAFPWVHKLLMVVKRFLKKDK